MVRRALILVNTGTPSSPGVKDVRRFLSEFLNDPMVIDLPWAIRKILVNLIIVPFRARRSAELYKKLWKEGGSPLLTNLENLVAGLQKVAGEKFRVYGAMRYGRPALKERIRKIIREDYDEIIVFPLFPQFASSTTGSVHVMISKEIRAYNPAPVVKLIKQYHSHPKFIEAFCEKIQQYGPENFDHVLFSYHSLPVRHINKSHPGIDCDKCNCQEVIPEHGKYCYRATCYETTRLIASGLSIPVNHFSTSFQSRMTGNWLSPYTDQVLQKLASERKKNVLVAAPSFVADCLETVVEIEDACRLVFRRAGGGELVMVRSLNESETWMDAIASISEGG